MRVLITNRDSLCNLLAFQLVAAGHEVKLDLSARNERIDVAVTALSRSADVERLRELARTIPGVPLLAVSRIPSRDVAYINSGAITLLYPGFGKNFQGPGRRRRFYPLALPGPAVGPVIGRPWAEDRMLVGLLRSAGIGASLREDMGSWLTVTSAWLSPLRGAVAAAAQRGLTLDATPDLITVAARAARERLRLLRTAGFHLEPGTFCLLNLPESWAIAAVREIARALNGDVDLPWLPTPDEALLVRVHLEIFKREQGAKTPAADFLDDFAREERQPIQVTAPELESSGTLNGHWPVGGSVSSSRGARGRPSTLSSRTSDPHRW